MLSSQEKSKFLHGQHPNWCQAAEEIRDLRTRLDQTRLRAEEAEDKMLELMDRVKLDDAEAERV